MIAVRFIDRSSRIQRLRPPPLSLRNGCGGAAADWNTYVFTFRRKATLIRLDGGELGPMVIARSRGVIVKKKSD